MKHFNITLLAHATVLLFFYFAGVIITIDWEWLSQLGIFGRTFFLVLYTVAAFMLAQPHVNDE